MRALLAAYFNRIDHGLPIHYFGNDLMHWSTLTLREEIFANFENLEYFRESLILWNGTMGTVYQILLLTKIAKILSLFLTFALRFQLRKLKVKKLDLRRFILAKLKIFGHSTKFLEKVPSLNVLKIEDWNVMGSWRKYKLHLFTRQKWTIRGATGEIHIFKSALWIVLQQNDENIQLNLIIICCIWKFEKLLIKMLKWKI